MVMYFFKRVQANYFVEKSLNLGLFGVNLAHNEILVICFGQEYHKNIITIKAW